MWLWVLSSCSPVSSLSLTCWRASVMEVSGRQLVCQPQTAAHLSFVISSTVFNLAVFLQRPSVFVIHANIDSDNRGGGGSFVSCRPLPLTSVYSFLCGCLCVSCGWRLRKTVDVTMWIYFLNSCLNVKECTSYHICFMSEVIYHFSGCCFCHETKPCTE